MQQRSLRSLEWLNFFLADVQTGLGPFLAAYLASSGWNPGRVGYALTFGGLVAVAMQTPAGAVIDAAHRKRALLAVNLVVLVAGAFLLMGRPPRELLSVPGRRDGAQSSRLSSWSVLGQPPLMRSQRNAGSFVLSR
jgi:MFS family permease